MGTWNQGYWFEFESKMASATNVVLMDDSIRDQCHVLDLVETQKKFSATLLFPIAVSFSFYGVDFLGGVCPYPLQTVHF